MADTSTPQPSYGRRPKQEEKEVETTKKPEKKARSGRNDSGGDTWKVFDRLFAEANRARDPWIQLWQEIYNYTLPQREHFYQATPGQQRTDLIFDETAVTGVPRFASRMTSGYFPQYGEIFSLSLGPESPKHLRNAEGEAKLEALTDMIHRSWQQSNFSAEISEGMVDLGIGTMNMMIEPGPYPGDVVFAALPPTHIAILRGYGDTIRGWFTWCEMALEDIKAQWPKGQYNDQFNNRLRTDPRAKEKVVRAVWETGNALEPAWKQVIVVQSMRLVVIDLDLKGEGACPHMTGRWSKTGLDAWGRGPLQLIMPAVKTCNLTVQLVLENAELALGGIWVYDDDGVFNPDNIILQPGTFIPKAQGSKLESLQSPARFDVSQLVLADMRMNIKKGLFIDEMDAPGKTPRSAYEIQSRIAETARDLSAPGARLVKEILIPMVNRTIYIFEKQGILDMIGMKVDGKALKLDVKSPFLRGQDAIQMNEMMQFSAQVNAIFGQGTSAMMFNRARSIPEMARRNGVSMTMLNSDAEVKKMMAEATVGQQQAQEGQMQQGMDPSTGDPSAMIDSLTAMTRQ